MSKTTEQLRQILAAGGGLIIDAGSKTTDQLRQIAATAATAGTTVTMTNTNSKTTDQLRQIAAAGPGHVIFDLR